MKRILRSDKTLVKNERQEFAGHSSLVPGKRKKVKMS
jgi:hypothetical protein